MAVGDDERGQHAIRVLCSKKSLFYCRDPGLQWLIGSSLFLSPFTVVSSFRCLHTLSDDPYSPDYTKEADEIRTLLLRGFDVIGALYVGNDNKEISARKAIVASTTMRNALYGDGSHKHIGAVAEVMTSDIQFFVSHDAKVENIDAFCSIIYEDNPEAYIWEKGCLLRCHLEFKLPVFVSADKALDVAAAVSSSVAAVAAKLKDPNVVYLVEGSSDSDEASTSIVLHGIDLDFIKSCSDSMNAKTSARNTDTRTLSCSHFCLKKKYTSVSELRENFDAIHVTILFNQSRNRSLIGAPAAEYLPASEEAKFFNVNFKLDVLSYAPEEFPIADAVSMLIVPALVDQLNSFKKAVTSEILQCPQFCPYHFLPPGLLHPITAIYDLRYGETEANQSEMRRCLHSRLGLPLDRPLLRTANALSFGPKGMKESKTIKYGSQLLKDVHVQIPSSGVSGGNISLISGSYEYYHYLVHGVDDNGWGCAYRSLQTIISWYRLQQYTSIEVPSHREIQQVLVEIGDKDPAFVGSREWIGAIELSFILDKLLGVNCKIINVRSGEELPEKCRELAMHFETQGTPIMIGGGVLAYTLLGVDYNELSGDCAFLILDPHYTGSDDVKKIVNGGWCGWKKAVDSKGRKFFLKDKFYNLLLPQRPNMV